ncbi:MAG TPA: response regulator [Nitrospirota bacterium]|nr:response regulator [Nitrospirota bacterium]
MRINQLKKKKILVIDDDELHLYTTRELLQDEDCEVISHKSNYGIGVTNLVRELQPDLILLDINMPGISGEQLAKLLRWRNTPFVFYSSNDEDSLRESALRHGAKGYICKGNIVELKNIVKKYLAKSTFDDMTISV